MSGPISLKRFKRRSSSLLSCGMTGLESPQLQKLQRDSYSESLTSGSVKTQSTPQTQSKEVQFAFESPISLNCPMFESIFTANNAQYMFHQNRYKLVNALYMSECQFAENMAVIVRVYMCSSGSLGLTAEELYCLFHNVSEILDVSLSLIALLEYNAPYAVLKGEPAENTDDTTVKVGMALCQFFASATYHVYEEYVRNSLSQLYFYKRLTGQRNKNFQNWLRKCAERSQNIADTQDLASLLFQPVARMTEYPRFIRGLIDSTPPSHPDYSFLEVALRRSEAYVELINIQINSAGIESPHR